MLFRLSLNSTSRRITIILGGLLCFALLAGLALTNFIAGVLSDTRVDVSRNLLTSGIGYVPRSAAVAARLADAEMIEPDRDLPKVNLLAQKAVNMSPWDYRYRLLLATVKEAEGDRVAAEVALMEAINLAPNNADVHWRLANLLLREGKLARAVPEFRAAVSTKPQLLLPQTLDLLWRVSGGNFAVVQAITPNQPKSRIVLAQFLLKQSKVSDAITVFAGIDRGSLVADPESSAFIDALIAGGNVEAARGLWIGLVSGDYAQPGRPLPSIWNGSFETEPVKGLGQFDWIISRSEYAVPTIDRNIGHTGNRSLRIDFTGRDTTKLDGQVKQTLQLRPGARYSLEVFVKTDRLDTPEGPRIVVADASSNVEIATSIPLTAGSNDWHRVALEFTAPQSSRPVLLKIQRVPKYSYDDPTRGTVWFDDFVLTQQSK